MLSDNHTITTPFIERLESVIALSASEKDAIRGLPVREAEIKADQDIVREGDRPTRMFFVIEGVTCSYKIAADSKRQIVNFHLQGDTPPTCRAFTLRRSTSASRRSHRAGSGSFSTKPYRSCAWNIRRSRARSGVTHSSTPRSTVSG
jgi:hypothetical protein